MLLSMNTFLKNLDQREFLSRCKMWKLEKKNKQKKTKQKNHNGFYTNSY